MTHRGSGSSHTAARARTPGVVTPLTTSLAADSLIGLSVKAALSCNLQGCGDWVNMRSLTLLRLAARSSATTARCAPKPGRHGRRWMVWALLAISVACGERPEKGASGTSTRASALISDQVHNGGTQGFFFLPPLVPATAYGTYSPGLAPVVTIDELSPGVRGNIASFTTSSGTNGAVVKDEVDHYQVNWDTKLSVVDPGFVYRISVKLEGVELGFADVAVVATGSALKNVATDEYIPLLDGRTLPIKFRIDSTAPSKCLGIVCTAVDACHEGGVCDSATGTCTTPVKSDGASCDDGNACTLTDVCVQGSCVGSAPVTCWAVDQCHDAGTCDPVTGVCSDPARLDGSSCDDSRRLHARRHLPGWCLRRLGSGDVRRAGPVPRGGDLRQLHRPLLESDEGERFGMQRRKRMFARGRLPGGHVRRHGARDVCRARRVSRRRLLQSSQRRVLESGEAGRRLLRGRQRVQRARDLRRRRQVSRRCPGPDRRWNPCTIDSCDPVLGAVHAPAPAGTSCADADLCNGGETCDGAGRCVVGAAPVLDDGTPAPRMRATRGSESCIRRSPDAGCCRRIPRPSHRPAI